jgi:hypothetical protein
MPGILKVGWTAKMPDERAKELYTTGVPLPFKIEFAKKVFNAHKKEKILHNLLEKYTERINPHREFFRVSPEEVRKFFDLIDGEMWEISSISSPSQLLKRRIVVCRDMTKCFINGQRIRHIIKGKGFSISGRKWIGTYDSSTNKIVCDGKFYTSLSNFAQTHYSEVRKDRCKEANGWKECEYEVDGKWISTYDLNKKIV